MSETEVRLDFCSPQQRDFVASNGRSDLFSGGVGSGKSRGGCMRSLRLLLEYPGCFGGIFRKSFSSLRATTLRTWEEYVCPPGIIRKHNKSEHVYYLKNGSRLLYGGVDKETKIGSLELGFVFADEAREFSFGDWRMLHSRVGRDGLIPAGGQMFGATNPDTPAHYLYNWFFRHRRGRAWESASTDNRLITRDYLARLEDFAGPYADRYVRGKWVSPEGLVYDCYDPLIHILEKSFLIPPSWKRYRAIDFGYSPNPFVCLWLAQSPNDDLYVYRELYGTRILTEDAAKQILALSTVRFLDKGVWRTIPERIEATWADHDSQERATLEKYGVYTWPAYKDRERGIQAVYARLSTKDKQGSPRKPRLLFMPDLSVYRDGLLANAERPTSILEEIHSYKRPEYKPERHVTDDPVKVDDHALDALRYAIAGIDLVGTTLTIGMH